jgi:hypothetical protein
MMRRTGRGVAKAGNAPAELIEAGGMGSSRLET